MPWAARRARELHGRVEVGEHRERGRVGEVVRRDVDGLEGGDRTLLGRGDPLLQRAHLGAEGRLVADLGGHPAHERRDLVAGLDEAEDVVHEEEHVLAELLAEVLGEGHAGEGHAEAGAGRLVHLAEDEAHVREDARLLELAVEVVTLAGALADAGEDRGALVLQGDVVDQLLDDDRLADAGAAEQAGLAAPTDRAEEVYDLDAGDELLRLGRQVLEPRRGAVDRPHGVRLLDGTLLVDGLAEDVDHAPEDVLADGDGYRLARVGDVQRRAGGRRSRTWRPCATMSSPRSCWTSRVSFVSSPFTSSGTVRALKISGISSAGNRTSTTGPLDLDHGPDAGLGLPAAVLLLALGGLAVGGAVAGLAGLDGALAVSEGRAVELLAALAHRLLRPFSSLRRGRPRPPRSR